MAYSPVRPLLFLLLVVSACGGNHRGGPDDTDSDSDSDWVDDADSDGAPDDGGGDPVDDADTTSPDVDDSGPLDTIAPVVTLIGPQTAGLVEAMFTFACDEPSCTFQCAVDSESLAACTSPVARAGLSAGAHTFSVAARDAAGNVSTTVVWPFAVITGAWFKVSVGDQHVCAIAGDGRLYCWGGNIALPSPREGIWRDIAAGASHSCGVSDTGALSCWNGAAGEPTAVGGATDWVAVSAGASHTCAKKTDNTLYCWGVGETEPQLVPLANVSAFSAGNDGTCAVSAGKLYCFGDNTNRRLALGDLTAVTTPTDTGLSGVIAVDLGSDHGCAIVDNGAETRCWGADGTSFSLGDGTVSLAVRDPVAVDLYDGSNAGPWTALGVGGASACAVHEVLGDRSLHCWGANDTYQLGIGVTGTAAHSVPSSSPATTWAQVAMGLEQGCGVLFDGELACWGGDVTEPQALPSVAPSLTVSANRVRMVWGMDLPPGEHFVVVRKDNVVPADVNDGTVLADPATSPVDSTMSALWPNTPEETHVYHYALFRCRGPACAFVDEATLAPTVRQALQGGGYAIYFRHAEANTCSDDPEAGVAWWKDVPPTTTPGDPSWATWWTLPAPTVVCPYVRSRLIDAFGITQSQAIGQALAAAGIPIDVIHSSEHDRASRTALEMIAQAGFGPVAAATLHTGLSYGATYLTGTAEMPADTAVEPSRCQVIRKHLIAPPVTVGDRLSNQAVVGHSAITQTHAVCAIVDPLARGQAAVFKLDLESTAPFDDPETTVTVESDARPTPVLIATPTYTQWSDLLQ